MTVAVSQKIGSAIDQVVGKSGLNDQILPFVSASDTYLCRNGIYLRKKNKGSEGFAPCSNFSLRIEESIQDDDTEILFHRMALTANGRKARFEVSDRQFQSGAILMRKATAAAVKARFPQMPRIDRGGLSLLPEIVKGTQMAPQRERELPGVWGFSWGSFQGPDYRVTNGGLRFGSYPEESLPGCVRMLCLEDPEIEGLGGMDFLRQKANELATWVYEQGGYRGLLARVVLYAALAWIHRGARNLNSFLALPSERHLEVLSWILGVAPVDVGRARREHPGVPRLMASSYWSLDQFKRQGRIVAALEETTHRMDGNILCLLRQHKETVPLPEKCRSSYLSVLSYAAIGQQDIGGAIDRLVSLVDDEETGRHLQVALWEGGGYLVSPGCYLERFFALSKQFSLLENCIIEPAKGGDCVLVKKSLVGSLARMDYQFREQRIADEIRERFGIDPPVGRYSRQRIPVFRVPRTLISQTGYKPRPPRE